VNTPLAPSKILGSWKEIAAYLGKGVRTVQRWEQLYGLPVRRPADSPLGVVYVSCEELDAWLARKWVPRQQPTQGGMVERLFGGTAELVRQSQQLRQDKLALIVSLHRNLDMLKQRCEQLKSLTAAARDSRSLWSSGEAPGTGEAVVE
jgi:hypothetical protein